MFTFQVQRHPLIIIVQYLVLFLFVRIFTYMQISSVSKQTSVLCTTTNVPSSFDLASSK